MLSKPFRLQNVRKINEFMFKFDELSVVDFCQIFKRESQISDNLDANVADVLKPKNLSFEILLAFGKSQAHVMSPKKGAFRAMRAYCQRQ